MANYVWVPASSCTCPFRYCAETDTNNNPPNPCSYGHRPLKFRFRNRSYETSEGSKMKIEVDKSALVFKEVYNSIVFETAEGHKYGICMRDDTIEVTPYSADQPEVRVFGRPTDVEKFISHYSKHIAPEQKANLGLATTGELLEELRVRAEVDRSINYRTVETDEERRIRLHQVLDGVVRGG